jgi:hypothetical protein
VGLHQAGHTVQCFGDPAIAQEFAAAGRHPPASARAPLPLPAVAQA